MGVRPMQAPKFLNEPESASNLDDCTWREHGQVKQMELAEEWEIIWEEETQRKEGGSALSLGRDLIEGWEGTEADTLFLRWAWRL